MFIEDEEYYSINIVDKRNGKVVASITDDLLLVDEDYQALYERQKGELLFRDENGMILKNNESKFKS